MNAEFHIPAAVQTAAFSLAAAFQVSENETFLTPETVLSLTVAGAIMGGFMACAFFPTHRSLKDWVNKWMSCTIFSVVFSPLVIDHLSSGQPPSFAQVLSVSGGIGMFAWFIAGVMFQFLQKRAKKEMM